MSAFCDVGVPWSNDKKSLFEAVQMCVKLGYDSVILNFMASDLVGKKKKKGIKETEQSIPTKTDMMLPDSAVESLKTRKFKQYTRFSVVLNDPAQTYKMQNSPEIQTHDILSVRPMTEKSFLQACQTLDIDLISLDLTERLPFQLRLPQVKAAIERGIHFEISYCPMIRDAGARRHIIANTQQLIRWCKGKNVVFSSSCESPMELRGPYDLVNLGLLFGLTEAQAKDAISTNCRALLLHARSRKTANCVASAIPVSNIDPKDQWKIVQDLPKEDIVGSGRSSADSDSDGESDQSEQGNVENGTGSPDKKDKMSSRKHSTDSEEESPSKRKKLK